MKKTYINPSITVVSLQQLQPLMTTSNVTLGNPYNGSATIESRDVDFFEDEDF